MYKKLDIISFLSTRNDNVYQNPHIVKIKVKLIQHFLNFPLILLSLDNINLSGFMKGDYMFTKEQTKMNESHLLHSRYYLNQLIRFIFDKPLTYESLAF